MQRQYTGSAGKVTNCQIGVSLAAATSSEQIPLDFELYLPETWAGDPARRAEARIPDAVTFKTKIDLALEMIERAALAGIPGNTALLPVKGVETVTAVTLQGKDNKGAVLSVVTHSPGLQGELSDNEDADPV